MRCEVWFNPRNVASTFHPGDVLRGHLRVRRPSLQTSRSSVSGIKLEQGGSIFVSFRRTSCMGSPTLCRQKASNPAFRFVNPGSTRQTSQAPIQRRNRIEIHVRAAQNGCGARQCGDRSPQKSGRRRLAKPISQRYPSGDRQQHRSGSAAASKQLCQRRMAARQCDDCYAHHLSAASHSRPLPASSAPGSPPIRRSPPGREHRDPRQAAAACRSAHDSAP